MGKKTIAEFVESESVLNALRDIGIDFVQGYRIGQPVLLEEL
jgi:EAL domain-containing protein (putative c-di-GMP-specific phosphodiesterase class I)